METVYLLLIDMECELPSNPPSGIWPRKGLPLRERNSFPITLTVCGRPTTAVQIRWLLASRQTGSNTRPWASPVEDIALRSVRQAFVAGHKVQVLARRFPGQLKAYTPDTRRRPADVFDP